MLYEIVARRDRRDATALAIIEVCGTAALYVAVIGALLYQVGRAAGYFI